MFPLALPFLGMLLSLAIVPVLAPVFWEKHHRKLIAFWLGVFSLFFVSVATLEKLLTLAYGAIMHDFLPFSVLIASLYVITGNIRLEGLYWATPLKNTIFLGCAGVLASFIGTTGAAMIFIRPFYMANIARVHMTHLMMFFIFIVANIGGGLTPLGDPPLFLGFLNGVPFFWPLQNMFFPTMFSLTFLLLMFFCIDKWFSRYEKKEAPPVERTFEGGKNFFLLLGVMITLIASGFFEVKEAESGYSHVSMFRDAILLMCAFLAYKWTPASVRKKNAFSLRPLLEVLAVFGCIFILVVPALNLLESGHPSVQGILSWFSNCKVGSSSRYFWGTGFFSSFLDNAPTYLMFVHLTNCGIVDLVKNSPQLLASIGSGAVFMGAMTYIGNAPNLMVKATVEGYGLKMPGFFIYVLWACAILLPTFYLTDYLFFSGNFSFLQLW